MSILLFEEHTEDLNEKELAILPFIIEGLNRCDSAKKSGEVCELIDMLYHKAEGHPLFMSGVRLRKFVSHIRANGLLPIISTSQGYFVSKDKEEIKKQIISLEQRSRQIAKAAEGLKKLL